MDKLQLNKYIETIDGYIASGEMCPFMLETLEDYIELAKTMPDHIIKKSILEFHQLFLDIVWAPTR